MKQCHLYSPKLSNIQRAYIAGFFDGEGCLNFYKSKSKSSIAGYTFVGVGYLTNTDLETLMSIKNMVGFGAIRKRNVYSYSGNRKECWNLAWSPRQLKALLPLLYPYLITKKVRAKIMMDFLNTMKWGRGQGNLVSKSEIVERQNLFHRFRYLNARGIQKKSGEFGEPQGIPSQATVGEGAVEGVETREMSPNNNSLHESPTRNGRYSPNSYSKPEQEKS